MAIQITAVRLSGGTTHQHITRLWWTNPATAKTGDNTRAEIVTWIEDEKGPGLHKRRRRAPGGGRRGHPAARREVPADPRRWRVDQQPAGSSPPLSSPAPG
ncbi:hypothetical protein GCM10020295_82630 [Streptomyces cinereospinus]